MGVTCMPNGAAVSLYFMELHPKEVDLSDDEYRMDCITAMCKENITRFRTVDCGEHKIVYCQSKDFIIRYKDTNSQANSEKTCKDRSFHLVSNGIYGFCEQKRDTPEFWTGIKDLEERDVLTVENNRVIRMSNIEMKQKRSLYHATELDVCTSDVKTEVAKKHLKTADNILTALHATLVAPLITSQCISSLSTKNTKELKENSIMHGTTTRNSSSSKINQSRTGKTNTHNNPYAVVVKDRISGAIKTKGNQDKDENRSSNVSQSDYYSLNQSRRISGDESCNIYDTSNGNTDDKDPTYNTTTHLHAIERTNESDYDRL
ncbi:unnamed protein product [Mytilus edulis]|uniref:Uncharacterized protein n=1 Tax=Mytilus edulis TaxID=6550 RepID=A0A8S3TZ12_MYTED|nr:unnamed protein product [Mytilus edulis]